MNITIILLAIGLLIWAGAEIRYITKDIWPSNPENPEYKKRIKGE